MTREEYQAKLDDAKRESIGDTYGWYVNLADISLDYIASLESENAKLKEALEKAAKSLYESTQSCPRDMFDWEHPATCDIECNTHSHVDDAWKCWLDWLMNNQNKGDTNE